MNREEILKYITQRIKDIQADMEEWGFNVEDMDEWTQGNYAAYEHLLAKILSY